MVALEEYVHDPRYDRLLKRALEGELNRWGSWIERHSEYEGYPGINILAAFVYGSGGEWRGHRILCLDMPTDVYATHHRILKCSEAEQEAIWIMYVVRVKPDGTLWTISERCLKCGISEETLGRRSRRAKQRILGLPVDDNVRNQVLSPAL